MRALEDIGQAYLFKLRQSAGVKRLVQRQWQRQDWRDVGQGWEAGEDVLQLTGWSQRRRVIVMRRVRKTDLVVEAKQVGRPKAKGQAQAELHFIDENEPAKSCEYSVLVCNTHYELESIGQLYRDRADCENGFDEIKNQWDRTRRAQRTGRGTGLQLVELVRAAGASQDAPGGHHEPPPQAAQCGPLVGLAARGQATLGHHLGKARALGGGAPVLGFWKLMGPIGSRVVRAGWRHCGCRYRRRKLRDFPPPREWGAFRRGPALAAKPPSPYYRLVESAFTIKWSFPGSNRLFLESEFNASPQPTRLVCRSSVRRGSVQADATAVIFRSKQMISKSLPTVALAALALCAGSVQAAGFANGGFETGNTAANPPGGSTYFAQGWLAAPTGNPALWSTVDAHGGTHSALLTVLGGFGGSTLFQNSIDHGGLPPLTAANVGKTPILSFWAKGDVSTTGNVLFAVRYLDGIGNILDGNGGNHFFQSQINTSSWSQITYQLDAIPVGTKALFLEMNTAVGPLLDGRSNAVYIDDINVAGVPEPETYALMLAGLAAVGAMVRRRRSV